MIFKIKHIAVSCLLLLLLGMCRLYGQQDPNYVFYRYLMNIINPAYAGAEGITSFTLTPRGQFQGDDQAPSTQTFFANTLINERTGLGASVVNDRTFVERQTSVYIDFSYRLQLSSEVFLYAGLKAGGNFFQINASGLETFSTAIDPLLTDESSFSPNVGVGILIRHENYFISLSSPRILNSRRVTLQNDIATNATNALPFFLSSGYNFRLSSQWFFKPSFLLRYTEGLPLSADLTAAIAYNEIAEFGIAYRTDSAISGLVLFNIADWISAGYAYDNSLLAASSPFNTGTHEILLKLKIPE